MYGRRTARTGSGLPPIFDPQAPLAWDVDDMHCFLRGDARTRMSGEIPTYAFTRPRTIAEADARCRLFVDHFEWALIFWGGFESHPSLAFVTHDRSLFRRLISRPTVWPGENVIACYEVESSLAETARTAFIGCTPATWGVVWDVCGCNSTGVLMSVPYNVINVETKRLLEQYVVHLQDSHDTAYEASDHTLLVSDRSAFKRVCEEITANRGIFRAVDGTASAEAFEKCVATELSSGALPDRCASIARYADLGHWYCGLSEFENERRVVVLSSKSGEPTRAMLSWHQLTAHKHYEFVTVF